MAGAHIRVDVENEATQLAVGRVLTVLDRPSELMRDIAQYLWNTTRERFKTQTDPSGKKWAPLNPAYRESKPKNKDKILTLNGYLSSSLVEQHTDQEAIVGFDSVYAAIHQFGGVIKPKNGRALKFGGVYRSSVKMPQRAMLGLSVEDEAEVVELSLDYVRDAIAGR